VRETKKQAKAKNTSKIFFFRKKAETDKKKSTKKH